MENKELLCEFTSLIKNNRAEMEDSKENFEEIYTLIEKEVAHTENMLKKMQQELADGAVRVGNLARKQQLIANSSLDLKKHIITRLSHDSRDTYQTVLDINNGLLAESEREQLALEQYCSELGMRLKKAQENEGKMAELFAQINSMDENINSMQKIMEKVQIGTQIRDFGGKVIKAQEAERRRVSREMHDGPAQAMANVVFLAEVCQKLIDIDTVRAKSELQELRKQVLNCLAETRKIVFDLRPMTLDDLGLIPTVKKIADMLKERTGIKSKVTLCGKYDEPLDSQIEISLFRIIQESLTNIEKHSHATTAKIAIDVQNDAVVVIIEDDGTGFVMRENDNNDCFGLIGMRERVSILNGELTIDSQQGSGTKISVYIPLVTKGQVKN